jgi:virginiamycin B lyase
MSTKSLLLGLSAVLVGAIPPAYGQAPPNLPDGPGKDAVVTYCSGCHGLNRVVASGYPQAYWNTAIRMMLNFGVPIPPDQINLVTDYLSSNFPEKPMPAAVIIPGPVQVTIREWQVPIPGSRPHDPLATRDGAIWYTGQMTNRLGRVDPRTGKIKEYPLRSPLTGPHGLVEDKEGNIWYTGNHQALVGKLDPKTGAVTEYTMPDPKAKDPHSLAFDPSGILWFTLQQSNMLGRLDPHRGKIKLLNAPTPRSRPYGVM